MTSIFEYEVQWTDSDGKLRLKWYKRRYNAENLLRTLEKQKLKATLTKCVSMDSYEQLLNNND
jgi:hypothetical protein